MQKQQDASAQKDITNQQSKQLLGNVSDMSQQLRIMQRE